MGPNSLANLLITISFKDYCNSLLLSLGEIGMHRQADTLGVESLSLT